MLRFIFILLTSLVAAGMSIYRLSYCASHDDFTEEQRYAQAQRTLKMLRHKGRITTDVYGEDNLPIDSGYIMYSNHQGKYDAIGILSSHKKPASVLMEYKKSKIILTSQFIDALRGKRLKFDDPRQQIGVYNEIAEEVAEGRKYLIFPEGGYTNNHNHLQDFSTGCFKCAKKAECPIVPVCIIDSWKPFGMNSLRKVKTQVHFLKPVEYIEYANMKTAEIGQLVRNRIADKLCEIIGEC